MGIWATPLDTTRLPLRTRPSGRVLTADSVLATNTASAIFDTTRSDTTESDTTGNDTTAADSPVSVERVVSQFNPQERHNWWVENDGIYFLRHRRLNAMVLTFYNFETQDMVPLYAFANLRPGQHVAAGPNGNWFAYTHVARRQSDLMLVEDFSEE
jgi:hypothetical protein